ncbi:MAG: HEAT repeat domain-containing protein [Acidimicrobiales bacterium]|nr:HEAT repeat domain-containing protein [Acidimicrobiales bacterium]
MNHQIENMENDNLRALTRLFRSTLTEMDTESLLELKSYGETAIKLFQAFLQGEIKVPGVNSRVMIDNIMEMSCWLAAHLPDEFLEAFNSPIWMSSIFVVQGLGHTRSPAALPNLINALSNSSREIRMSAAIALGHIYGNESRHALRLAVNDREYLVRYHAISSIGKIGDLADIEWLSSLAASNNRGISEAVSIAISSISNRRRKESSNANARQKHEIKKSPTSST